ncbi:MAG: chaperone modulator CbpM [Mycobacteriaceae bacterium]
MNTSLVRAPRLDIDTFARLTGLHPEMVRRWVALGLLDGTWDSRDHLWFAPSQVAAVARLQRLRAGFALNYAALGLVADLLDRISALEAAASRTRRPKPKKGSSWTRIG